MAVVHDGPAALIARHIVAADYTPDDPEAWVRETGVSVWALIDYWYGHYFDTAATAAAYAISSEAMTAALAYYRHHQSVIDARRLLNAV